MKLQGKIINFLGDSITEGVGASCTETQFSAVLAKEAGLKAYRNYGISGTRIARQQNPEPGNSVDVNEFCKRYADMAPADVIVVFGGTNDYGHGDAPFGMPDDRTPDTYWGAVHVLLRGLLEQFPTATVVVMTPIHREYENVQNRHGKTLKDYVEVLRKACDYYSIPMLDLYACAGIYPDVAGQKAAFAPDGLHPNDAGNAVIAARLQRFLENL